MIVRALLTGLVLSLGGCAVEGEEEYTGGEGEHTEGEVNPSRVEAISCSMPACGTALASFDGTTAYSNGSNTTTGVSCGGTGRYGYQYQCVELVMRHFSTHWGLSWRGNAKDLLNNAPRASVDVYNNGDAAHPPVPGDMLVWTNSTYGHVALITAVRADAIDIIEQNACGNGRATLSYSGGRIGSRWSSWVPAGWAHARANNGTGTPGPNPNPNPTPTNCTGSASGSSSIWTCTADRRARQRCVSGSVETETCAAGCEVRPTGTDDTCAPSTTCRASGQSCSTSSPCCSGLSCNSGTCGSAPTCRASGQSCSTSSPCCSGLSCNSGTCGSAPTCRASGQSCSANSECCSGLSCNSGTCGTAPSTGWNCSTSAYNGVQYWTCSGTSRYRCSGTTPQSQACQQGCLSRPAGTDDLCIDNASGWTCSRSAYNGAQYWTCSNGSLFRCNGSTPVVVNCPSGCTVRAVGTDDTCN